MSLHRRQGQVNRETACMLRLACITRGAELLLAWVGCRATSEAISPSKDGGAITSREALQPTGCAGVQIPQGKRWPCHGLVLAHALV